MNDRRENWCTISKPQTNEPRLQKCPFFVFSESFRTKSGSGYNDEIVIQVSNNVLHQISSRIFGTLMKETWNYNIIYEDITFTADPKHMSEKDKIYDTLEQIVKYVKEK